MPPGVHPLPHRAYPIDQAKVELVINLLVGKPLTWAFLLLETSSPLLNNLEEFLQDMSQMYADPLSPKPQK